MSWKSARPERPRSLRLRLALIFAAGSLATLLVALGFLEFGFRHAIDGRNRQLLAARLQDVASVLAHHPDDPRALVEEVLGDAPASGEEPSLVRVLRDGRLLLESPGMGGLLPAPRFSGGSRVLAGQAHFLVAQLSAGPDLIQGALNVTEDDRATRTYRRYLLSTLLAVAAGCSLLGAWAARQGLQPLRAMAEAARGITAERLRQRLDPGDAPLELRDLVEALNAMLDRLELAFERLSRFSADLAHELRTPINNLMGEAEVSLSRDRTAGEYRQVLESSMDEFSRLSRLISRMLFLAGTEDPASAIRPVPVPAGPLLEKLLAFYEALAEEQSVTLAGVASGTLQGDPDLLRQALANLVANALEATPAGGTVRVRVEARDGQAELEVADTGRGIPADELPRLADRFFRTTEALEHKRPGTGLGLAIVQSIARLHGGELRITNEQGRGTTARLRFPA